MVSKYLIVMGDGETEEFTADMAIVAYKYARDLAIKCQTENKTADVYRIKQETGIKQYCGTVKYRSMFGWSISKSENTEPTRIRG